MDTHLNLIMLNQKTNKGKYNLEISNIQLRETCSSVIKLNNKIEKVIPKTTKVGNN